MFKQLKLPFFNSKKPKPDNSSSDEYDPDEEARKSEQGSMWTRVKAIDSWKSNTVQVYDFEKDIQSDLGVAKARHHIQNQSGKCEFDPDDFAHKGVDYSLSNNRPSQREIEGFAELATRIRKNFEVDRKVLQRLLGD